MTGETTLRYALFHGLERISKPHSTKGAVEIEAFERGIMLYMPAVATTPVLARGYSIKQVDDAGAYAATTPEIARGR